MTTSSDPVRSRMAAANPAPPDAEPPRAVMTADDILDIIDSRARAIAPEASTHGPSGPVSRRRTGSSAWALVGGFVLAAVTVGVAVLLFRGDTGNVVDQPAVTTTVPLMTSTTPPVTTTETPTTPPTAAPEVTTATTLPAPFVGVVSLDPDAIEVQFAAPSLALDAEGRPQVLYRRNGSVVALATCVDPECSTVSIRDVHSSTGAPLVGTPRPDSGPVFWVGRGGDVGPEAVLVVCPDLDCAEPTVLDVSGVRPAIAADASGRVVVASVDRSEGALSLLQCFESSCSGDVTSRWNVLPERWLGDAAVALRDGLPVVAMRTDQGVTIAECAEFECMPGPGGPGIDVVASIPIEQAVMGPLLGLGRGGAPVAIVQVDRTLPGAPTWSGAIVVAACEDAACNTVVVTELSEIDDMYSEWAMATGPDGRVRIAWTQHASLFLATCQDGTCSQHSIVDTGHHADDIALAFDPAGSPVIATSSRDRGLELVYCGDDACRIAD